MWVVINLRKQKTKDFLTVAGKTFSVVSNILTIVSWLGITATSIFLYFTKNYFLIIPIVLLLTLVICIFICKRNNVDIIKAIMAFFAYNMKYSFDEWVAEYEYHSKDTMSFKTSYTVRALQTGVDHIYVRFNWSGATDEKGIDPRPVNSGNFKSEKMEFCHKEYGYNYYKLFSKNVINKGDHPIQLGYKLENLNDSLGKASPHLLTSISVVTKKLKMIVILPQNIKPQNIRCLEYLHSTDDYHWHDLSDNVKPELIGKRWHIIWEIEKPVFGGKYILSWEPEIS